MDFCVYCKLNIFNFRSAQVKTCTVVSPITIGIFAGPAKLSPEYIKEAESGVHTTFRKYKTKLQLITDVGVNLTFMEFAIILLY